MQLSALIPVLIALNVETGPTTHGPIEPAPTEIERSSAPVVPTRPQISNDARIALAVDQASNLVPRLGFEWRSRLLTDGASRMQSVRLDLRSRTRWRSEQIESVNADSSPRPSRAAVDQREGWRGNISWQMERKESDGEQFSLLLSTEAQRIQERVDGDETGGDGSPISQFLQDEQSNSQQSGFSLDYLSAARGPWRVGLRSSGGVEESDRTARNETSLLTGSSTLRSQSYETQESRLELAPRLQWRAPSGARLTLRFEGEVAERSSGIESREAAAAGVKRSAEIREVRLEPGVGLAQALGPSLRLDVRADVEISRLQTESFEQSVIDRTIHFKPTVRLDQTGDDGGWQAWLTRTVSHLEFEEFGESLEEFDDLLPLVLPTLKPQSAWEIGLDVELGTQPGRQLKLGARYRDITDLLDVIEGPSGTSVRGNLGNATAWELRVGWETRFAFPGLPKGNMEVEAQWHMTEVFDPLIATTRAFADTPETVWQVVIDQPLSHRGTNFRLEARDESDRTTVETDRVEIEDGNAPFVTLALEWDLDNGTEASIGVANVLDAKDVRQRTRYSGYPREGDIRRIETRSTRDGRIVQFSLRRRF